jgi:hypothetical protein
MKLIPRKEWENLTYFAGGSHGMDERSEINPGKSGLPKFFTIFAEINKYNKYENKIEYTD